MKFDELIAEIDGEEEDEGIMEMVEDAIVLNEM